METCGSSRCDVFHLRSIVSDAEIWEFLSSRSSSSNKFNNWIGFRQVTLAEWLRRVLAKHMGFPRESSNLLGDEKLSFRALQAITLYGRSFEGSVYSFVQSSSFKGDGSSTSIWTKLDTKPMYCNLSFILNYMAFFVFCALPIVPNYFRRVHTNCSSSCDIFYLRSMACNT